MFPVPLTFWNAQIPVLVHPSVGALLFTGSQPLPVLGPVVFPSARALALSGTVPIVTSTITNIARAPSAAGLAIIGTLPGITIDGDQAPTPGARALTITRQPPTVTIQTPLTFFVDGALSNGATTNPFTYTVVKAIPAGRLAVVLIGARSNATVTAVSDNRGNAYTIDATDFVSGKLVSGGVARSRLTTGLSPGDTISITVGSSIGGAAAIVGSVANTQAAPFDRAASAVGSGTTPSVSTTATANAKDIVFAFQVTSVTTGLNGGGAGYTVIGAGPPAGPGGSVIFASNRNALVAVYKIVSSTGVQTFSVTNSTTSNWVACIAAYKGT